MSILQPLNVVTAAPPSGVGYLECDFTDLTPGNARSPSGSTTYNTAPGDYLVGYRGDDVYGFAMSFWFRVNDLTLDTSSFGVGSYPNYFPIVQCYNSRYTNDAFGVCFRNDQGGAATAQALHVWHGDTYHYQNAASGTLTNTLWGSGDNDIIDEWFFIEVAYGCTDTSFKTYVYIRNYGETKTGYAQSTGSGALRSGSIGGSYQGNHSIACGGRGSVLTNNLDQEKKGPWDICQLRIMRYETSSSPNGRGQPFDSDWYTVDKHWKDEINITNDSAHLNSNWSIVAAYPLSEDLVDIVTGGAPYDMTLGEGSFQAGGPF